MNNANERMYVCIDLKSFYASVECVERGLDPFKTNLVVSDPSRGEGAVCLAVSPAMKALGVKNRCRVFEIPQGLEYITAKPRMKLYMRYSAQIYSIYLRYFAKEDMHEYSVDECFIDVTPYFSLYRKSAVELAKELMDTVMKETGICATAGVGTNLFLAKVALDITAKHSQTHIGYLDEEEFKRLIWHHTPITDIWNIGKGIARRLSSLGAYDLYDVTQLDEGLLYKEFGVNARHLIDHAHGRETCTIKDIHEYQAKSRSLSNSQILFEDYSFEEALIILREMTAGLCLELVQKGLKAGGISLLVGYSDDMIKPDGGTRRLGVQTDSRTRLAALLEKLYRETANPYLPIRRIGIAFTDLGVDNEEEQSFFGKEEEERELKNMRAVLEIKCKFGKNAIINGNSLFDKATAIQRNLLVGGHNAE